MATDQTRINMPSIEKLQYELYLHTAFEKQIGNFGIVIDDTGEILYSLGPDTGAKFFFGAESSNISDPARYANSEIVQLIQDLLADPETPIVRQNVLINPNMPGDRARCIDISLSRLETGEILITWDDVSEKMFLEQQRDILNHRISRIFNSPIVGMMLSVDGSTIESNLTLLRDFCGFDPDTDGEVLNENGMFERLTPESQAIISERIQKRGKGEIVSDVFEIDMYAKNGQLIHLIGYSVQTPIGDKTGVMTLFVNLTNERKTISELANAVEILSHAEVAGRMGSFELNLYGNQELVLSDNFIELFGLPEFLKKCSVNDFLEYIHPDDRERFEHVISSNFDDTIELEFTCRILAKESSHDQDAEYKTIGIRAVVLETEEHGYSLVRGVGIDVTEQMAARQMIVESLALHRSIFESNFVGIALLNDDLKLQEANPALLRLMGYDEADRAEFLEKPISKLVTKKSRRAIRDEIQRVEEQNEPAKSIEIEVICKDGTTKAVEFFRSRIEGGPHGPVIQALLIDITDRKLAEHDALLTAHLEAIDKIAHDLRTPLTSIKNNQYLTRQAIQRGMYEKAIEYCEKIDRQADYASELINEMLAAAKLEREKIEFSRLYINDVIRQVVDANESAAQAKNISLLCELGENFAYQGSFPHLVRAITNLVSNAIRYTDADKDIIIRARMVDSTIVIEVEDHGIGIAEDEKERIFEKFYRSQEAKRMEPFGSGLGLHITILVAEKHGGKLELESTLGKGSTFRMVLPIYRES